MKKTFGLFLVKLVTATGRELNPVETLKMAGLQDGDCLTALSSPATGRIKIGHTLYPLVMTNVANWKVTLFKGKILYKLPFSIAMLNYQRGNSSGFCGFVTLVIELFALEITHKMGKSSNH